MSATVSAIDACVTVVDNGDGTLTATAVYGDAGNEFVNTYTAAPVEASLVGKKNLQVPAGLTPADIAGKFTFTVTGEEGAPMPANASVTNDAKGKIDFGKITFTLDDLNKALGEKPEKREHTFTYTVTESGKVAGVTNDAKLSREVSFTVTDDGKGNLRVSRKSDGSAAFTFINTYSVTPKDSSVTDKIKATKYLTGRDMAEGEFSFELVEGEGKDAKVVATGTNNAEGKITMNAVKYDKPGKHTYTLREAKGNAGGITYSDAKFTIETTITDNGDGTLKAEHVLKDVDEAKFTNSYRPGSKDSSVTDLIKDESGRVVGFHAKGENGASYTLRGKAVCLALAAVFCVAADQAVKFLVVNTMSPRLRRLLLQLRLQHDRRGHPDGYRRRRLCGVREPRSARLPVQLQEQVRAGLHPPVCPRHHGQHQGRQHRQHRLR